MKKLLIALLIVSMFFIVSAKAAPITKSQVIGEVNDLTVIETVTTTDVTASCKTQSHKLSFVTSSGTEIAWIKLNGVNACWSTSCMTLQNSTRSKWAASGYYWVLLGAVLGGKSCTKTTFQKYSNAELHMPGKSGYLTHQEMNLRFAEPLDYNWSSWKTPVVWP